MFLLKCVILSCYATWPSVHEWCVCVLACMYTCIVASCCAMSFEERQKLRCKATFAELSGNFRGPSFAFAATSCSFPGSFATDSTTLLPLNCRMQVFLSRKVVYVNPNLNSLHGGFWCCSFHLISFHAMSSVSCHAMQCRTILFHLLSFLAKYTSESTNANSFA